MRCAFSHTRPNIITTGINSPKISNAFEIYLYNQRLTTPNLFIRRSIPTVVMGCHQNPWIECNLTEMRKHNVELMRRTSGGGTVYLDEGNLLVGFVGSSKILTKKHNNQIVIDAIKDVFNVDAIASGRNDITVDGKKVAGAAFRLDNGHSSFLHHLSILVDGNINALEKYLTPDKRKLEAKGVTSVRARVKNLMDIGRSKIVYRETAMDGFSSALIKQFMRQYNLADTHEMNVTHEDMLNIPEVAEIYNHLNSEKWLYGNTPVFTHKMDQRFTWGTVYLFLNVTEGRISDITCNTDALLTDIPSLLKGILVGLRYNKVEVRDGFDRRLSIETDNELRAVLEDVRNWMQNEI